MLRGINSRLSVTRIVRLNPHRSRDFLLKAKIIRSINEASFSSNTKLTPKEIEFPVVYGRIAGLEYGDSSGRPTLALHGWLDNCLTFEPLLPLILEKHDLNVIAIDEPGTGLSSHKPPGSEYSIMGFCKEIKNILDIKGWKDVTLLAHSQGACTAILFASIFPELIKCIISLDTIKPVTECLDPWSTEIRKYIENHLKIDRTLMESRGNQDLGAPVYNEQVILQRLMKGQQDSLNEKSARIMLKRGSKPHKNGFIFTRDLRISKPYLDAWPGEAPVEKLVNNLKADFLIINSAGTIYPEPPQIAKRYYQMYVKNCKLFNEITVDGTHHVHMNEPEKVAPIINQFLEKSFNGVKEIKFSENVAKLINEPVEPVEKKLHRST